jgi:hypothetical protein
MWEGDAPGRRPALPVSGWGVQPIGGPPLEATTGAGGTSRGPPRGMNLPPGGTFAGTSEAQAARPPARPGGLPVHPLTAARRQRQKADGRRQETRWQALAESAAVAPPSELREDSPLTGCGNHARYSLYSLRQIIILRINAHTWIYCYVYTLFDMFIDCHNPPVTCN